ncbi:GAF domain-containing protein [Sphingobacterium sp. lm-10]|uniref:GAF domain-containing protein n=1 Tax=Sphingobacterium sp. lm-10 TaxID=2944904 RepID=UPI0020215145|nr:GAF domain-containing protein [Sphingobacterium sp. lm-10]MCL7986577.1 GAF domain-containing protein [Sphingobacterium sp. lm-10]
MGKNNFDSEFCGALPIHHINTIQPYGAILVIDKERYAIVQTTTNAAEKIGFDHKEIIGKTLGELCNLSAEQLRDTLGLQAPKTDAYTLQIGEKAYYALVHEQADYFVVELQEKMANKRMADGLKDIKNLMLALEGANSLPQVCDLIVSELKQMLGIDGVMMYQFDDDWNGTVISEQKSNGLENYLGVTFPASDVPKQARELYLKNPLRLIPDRTYTPARLFPVINPLTNSFTNLSSCHLRGVADVHLEYMANMKMCGSLSIRVIHNGNLWGLISCNHTSAYHLTFDESANFGLLSNVISNKISSIINANEYQFISKMQTDRNAIVDAIYSTGSVTKGIFGEGESKVSLLTLFHATGAVLFSGGKQYVHGQVPDANFLDNLILWLQAKDIDKIYTTHHLAGVMEESAQFSEIASGMLVIPISSFSPDYIVCFRPEVIKTIEWGGNPHHAINFEDNGLTYHPRHSFKIWMETVNQIAQPWHEQEIQIANTIRSFLLEFKS